MPARKHPQRKGARGEREVVAMFRDNGWPRAARSPGSGSLRPYGEGDSSPWPGDLAFVKPFLVEVKYDERWADGGARTWMGSTFVKGVLRDLRKLQRRKAIGGGIQIPVLFVRSAQRTWSVWVPQITFLSWFGSFKRSALDPDEWVQITVDDFFDRAREYADD